jgi:hypothetical protein
MFLKNIRYVYLQSWIIQALGSFIIQYLHVFKKYRYVYLQNWIIQAFRQFYNPIFACF